MIYDINPGNSSSRPGNFTKFNNKLYFEAADGEHGSELWEYDGINNPSLVYDINPGISISRTANFAVFDNKIYFAAVDENHGEELWVYNPEIQISGNISYFGTTNPLSGVELQFFNENNSYVNSTISDANGNYSIALPNGSYNISPLVALPVNNVNVVDALMISQAYVGTIQFSKFQQRIADVNSDGVMNIVDALIVNQLYVGLMEDFSQFGTPDWIIDKQSINIYENSVINFQMACAGDVNSSYFNSNLKSINADINDVCGLDINKNNNYRISQNYPNGIRVDETTTIKYYLPDMSFVDIKVYSILGEEVATLKNDIVNSGEHSIEFSPLQYQMKPGYYIYTFNAKGTSGNYSQTMKMLVIE